MLNQRYVLPVDFYVNAHDGKFAVWTFATGVSLTFEQPMYADSIEFDDVLFTDPKFAMATLVNEKCRIYTKIPVSCIMNVK